MEDKFKSLYEAAQVSLENDYERLRITFSEENGTPIGIFIERVMAWHTNNHQLLWEFLNEVIDFSDKVFMESFHGFVVNQLLDDGGFRIEWRKPIYDDGFMLRWLPDGSYETETVDENDPCAYPVVVRDDNGTQDVSFLMKAMDRLEHDQLEHEKIMSFAEET